MIKWNCGTNLHLEIILKLTPQLPYFHLYRLRIRSLVFELNTSWSFYTIYIYSLLHWRIIWIHDLVVLNFWWMIVIWVYCRCCVRIYSRYFLLVRIYHSRTHVKFDGQERDSVKISSHFRRNCLIYQRYIIADYFI